LQKHIGIKEQKKQYTKKFEKFRNFRKIGGGEIFSQNDEEHSTDD
jgi:hypothetical protein